MSQTYKTVTDVLLPPTLDATAGKLRKSCDDPWSPTSDLGRIMLICCAQEICQDPHYRCQHSEAERCIMGTWVTAELQNAKECGYELKKIYEVWHFLQKSQDLFRNYRYLHRYLFENQTGSLWISPRL